MNSKTHDIIIRIWKVANIQGKNILQMILFTENETLLLSARQVFGVPKAKSNIYVVSFQLSDHDNM
jgi:hypothetical protein